jgi:hypothetical protein
MDHQVTLEIPDEVYQPLLRKAKVSGQTVEAVANARLAEAAQAALRDTRLRRWAGAFASDVPDAAVRHHEYLGQALGEELQGKKDA